MKAWVFQYPKDVKAKGADGASHYCGWIDPDGKRKAKSFGTGKRGLKAAQKHQKQVEAELLTGTYQAKNKSTWQQFRKEYDSSIIEKMDARSKGTAKCCLKHFERIAKPVKMVAIKTATILAFVAERLKAGKSPATVNKELRYVRAALRTAVELEYLSKVPSFKSAFQKEPKRLPTYVPPEHFGAIYKACETARFPSDIPNVSASDWWQALLVTAYMTGWRISQLLALKWSDVNLDEGTALSRADDNKGRRDTKIPLHSVVVEHLKRLEGSFDSYLFPWNNNIRTLWTEFERIQIAAGTPKEGKHGSYYGFHDLRRGFATMNAGSMSADALQALMQHKSYSTTQGYINLARQLRPAVQNLFVPLTPKTAN